MQGTHEGHRKRMKEQFINNGIEIFQEHQILEMLLFYSLPRGDTNPVAHRLIDKFKSLAGVIDAPISELTEISGITENTAVLLKLVPAIAKVYSAQRGAEVTMDNLANIKSYFSHQFIGEKDELLKVCTLDDNLRVQGCVTVEKGVPNATPVSARKIAEAAIRSGCSLIILAHNHPKGSAEPSQADISTTRRLTSILADIGITLLDHCIVGSNAETLSMKGAGYFDIL